MCVLAPATPWVGMRLRLILLLRKTAVNLNHVNVLHFPAKYFVLFRLNFGCCLFFLGASEVKADVEDEIRIYDDDEMASPEQSIQPTFRPEDDASSVQSQHDTISAVQEGSNIYMNLKIRKYFVHA